MSDDSIAAMERLKDKAPQAAELLRQLANATREVAIPPWSMACAK